MAPYGEEEEEELEKECGGKCGENRFLCCYCNVAHNFTVIGRLLEVLYATDGEQKI